MSHILRKLKYDYIDLKIVEILGKEGPRNIFKISKIMGLPESTVRHRINIMKQRGILKLYTNIYHTNIGLKKAVVFADINPMYVGKVFDFMAAIPYWVYMEKTHGCVEGVHILYTIPPINQKNFVEFLDELVSMGVLEKYSLIWSTCFHRVNPTTVWYDLEKKDWNFRWHDLIKEMDEVTLEISPTLQDPKKFPILADKIDIFILKELERDATISLSDLAKKLNISVQNIRYHFTKHIEERYLIEDYQIFFKRFDIENSLYPGFLIEFTSYKNLIKTANVLKDKPFIEALGKILNKNMLLVYAYLPLKEFFNMINIINEFVKLGIVKRYKYWITYPLEQSKRQTIPYQNFMGDHWLYNHDKYMEKIHKLYREIKVQ